MRAAAELRKQIESALAGRIPAALSPRPRQSPELLSCGIPEVDALLGGGLPLGAIVELAGAPSSGRTTVALSTVAELTRQGHCCAYVDSCDALDPLSAAALGVELPRLLWVRLGSTRGSRQIKGSNSYRSLEAALRATDLLLNCGGFRAVVLDLADVPPELARRTPLTTWYRFRLQAEKSQTLLLMLSPHIISDPISTERGQRWATRHSGSGLQSCAAVSLLCDAAAPDWRRAEAQSPPLLAALRYHFSLQRNTGSPGKKPPASTKGTNWHGTLWRDGGSWTG